MNVAVTEVWVYHFSSSDLRMLKQIFGSVTLSNEVLINDQKMGALTVIYKYKSYIVIASMTVINDMFQPFQKQI